MHLNSELLFQEYAFKRKDTLLSSASAFVKIVPRNEAARANVLTQIGNALE